VKSLQSFANWASSVGISSEAFSLNGDGDEKYCLVQTAQGDWMVYYSERGMRRNPRDFTTLETALAALRGRILADPTTRIQYRNDHKWTGNAAP